MSLNELKKNTQTAHTVFVALYGTGAWFESTANLCSRDRHVKMCVLIMLYKVKSNINILLAKA